MHPPRRRRADENEVPPTSIERPGKAIGTIRAVPFFRWQTATTIIVLAFVVTRLCILLRFTDMRSDVFHYGSVAQKGIDAHQAVYRDFGLEYPPVAWWLIAMPRLLDGKSYPRLSPGEPAAAEFFNWYCPFFHLELCVVDIVCLVLMFKLGKMMLPTAQWVLPAAYTLMALRSRL